MCEVLGAESMASCVVGRCSIDHSSLTECYGPLPSRGSVAGNQDSLARRYEFGGMMTHRQQVSLHTENVVFFSSKELF